MPPWLLAILAMITAQVGAAMAEGLFDAIGFPAVVFLRTFLGGIIFLLLVRPRLFGYSRRVYFLITIYGAAIAFNMLTFYAAIDRLPLGIAIAIGFSGPLTLSVIGSRRLTDLIWVALAIAGILLLSPITDASLDPVGLLMAFACAVAWAAYILATKRASNLLPGSTTIALAMCMAALVSAPFGAARALGVLASPTLMATALVVALVSSVIPFWLEFRALRNLAPRVFGLLMSLQPAIGALIGWLILHENLGLETVIGIALVCIAAAATTRLG